MGNPSVGRPSRSATLPRARRGDERFGGAGVAQVVGGLGWTVIDFFIVPGVVRGDKEVCRIVTR
jgi:hypothetical protein